MLEKKAFVRIAHWSLSALMVLSILAAALPQTALAASSTDNCSETYTVKAGETIYRVARNHSVTVNKLAKANKLESPYTLETGQQLCIPLTSENNTKITWTATMTAGQVKVVGSGFKKTAPYVVRARETDTSAWFKLGKFATDKNGEVSETFKLPKDLQGKQFVNVCLKNAVTDTLLCKRAHLQ